jgi:hypothetical protein
MFNKNSKKRKDLIFKIVAIIIFVSMIGFSIGTAILG